MASRLSTLDLAVAAWWSKKIDEIYALIPDFAGFTVKADSEGRAGPSKYGRSPADAANVLARALKPHGGVVLYHGFVYNHHLDWNDLKADRDLLLFFHHVPYTHVLHSGKALVQSVYDDHYAGPLSAASYVESWERLKGKVDDEQYDLVDRLFRYQAGHAIVCDQYVVPARIGNTGYPRARWARPESV